MNQLTKEKRIQVLRALVEDNSIRSTVRIIGVAKNTVVKLLRDIGEACRIHTTLRITPAMVAGISTRLWDIEDIVNFLEKS